MVLVRIGIYVRWGWYLNHCVAYAVRVGRFGWVLGCFVDDRQFSSIRITSLQFSPSGKNFLIVPGGHGLSEFTVPASGSLTFVIKKYYSVALD